jgi:hypothetical protein
MTQPSDASPPPDASGGEPAATREGTVAKTGPRPTQRQRKFTLPEHHDEGASKERIEAFLEGPATRRRRPSLRRQSRHRAIEFDTTDGWTEAVRQEAARQARYGRPIAVIVIEVEPDAEALDADTATRRVIEAIGREARETDRAVRTSVSRLMLMLPETTEEDAGHLANRIERAYRSVSEPIGAPGLLDILIAIPRRGTDPIVAIDDAVRRLDAPIEEASTSA